MDVTFRIIKAQRCGSDWRRSVILQLNIVILGEPDVVESTLHDQDMSIIIVVIIDII